MRLAHYLDRIIPDLSAAILRFPVPALYAILLGLYLNITGSGGLSDETVSLAAAAGFLASGAGHLFAEGRTLPRSSNILIALGAGLAAMLVAYGAVIFQTSQLLLFSGLVLGVMIAGFLHEGAGQGALWLFNLRFGLAALLAMVVAVVFGLGLSAIVEALNLLFDAGLASDLHEHIWVTAAALVGPLFGLTLIPKTLRETIVIADEKGTLLERGVSVMVNYVLVPIILVYAAILHAYAVKIAAGWSLPKGQIGLMVTIYALGGTGAWLVAWPWRDSGTRLLRWFMGGWFWLTIVPAVLLAVAIWRRVSDYGVTPERYMIMLTAVWIAGLTVYLALRRNRADMRLILGGLAVLLLLGSVGPFGANGLTTSTQLRRLAVLLEERGVLRDGAYVTPPKPLDAGAKTEGYSILYALQESGGLGRLRPWFEGSARDPFALSSDGWTLFNNLSDALGFSAPTIMPDQVNYLANAPTDIAVPAGARLIGPLELVIYPATAPRPAAEARIEGADLVVTAANRQWRVPVAEFLTSVKNALAPPGQPQPPVVYIVGPDLRIAIESLYGTLGETPALTSARLWLIVSDTQG